MLQGIESVHKAGAETHFALSYDPRTIHTLRTCGTRNFQTESQSHSKMPAPQSPQNSTLLEKRNDRNQLTTTPPPRSHHRRRNHSAPPPNIHHPQPPPTNLRNQPNQPLPFPPTAHHSFHSSSLIRPSFIPAQPDRVRVQDIEAEGREPEGWFRLVDGKRSDDKEEDEEEDEGGGKGAWCWRRRRRRRGG